MRRPRFHFPNVSLRRDRLTRFDSLTEAWESWRANFTTTPTVPGRNPSRIHVCPECGSVNLIEDFDQGETICQDCGLVLSQNLMSRGPEWRAFTKEEKDEREIGRASCRERVEV